MTTHDNAQSQTVGLGDRSYTIWYGGGMVRNLGKLMVPLSINGAVFIISHPRLKKLFGRLIERSLFEHNYRVEWSLIPEGETYKQLKTIEPLYQQAAQVRIDKSSVAIGLGGGVVQDVANYFAATYMRGIAFVQLPTSLLSQVDVGIGGCAVDLDEGKSLVGTFYQPKLVVMDSSFLSSLPQEEVVNGLAEIINKVLCLGGGGWKRLIDDLDEIRDGNWKVATQAIIESNRIKKQLIEQDEIGKKGIRLLLDWGHTITYALERAMDFRVSHGWALGIGMYGAAMLSMHLGFLTQQTVDQLKKTIIHAGLPVFIPKSVTIDSLIRLMYLDQKVRGGRIRFILMRRFGDCFVSEPIDESKIRTCLEMISEQ